jgi:hypothetical protein
VSALLDMLRVWDVAHSETGEMARRGSTSLVIGLGLSPCRGLHHSAGLGGGVVAVVAHVSVFAVAFDTMDAFVVVFELGNRCRARLGLASGQCLQRVGNGTGSLTLDIMTKGKETLAVTGQKARWRRLLAI